MTCGYFTRTYEIWRATQSRDDDGAPINAWTKLADVAGRAYKKSLTYRTAADMPSGFEDWTFACAFGTDIEVADQVRFDNRTLAVRAISQTSRGDRLECLCVERQ